MRGQRTQVNFLADKSTNPTVVHIVVVRAIMLLLDPLPRGMKHGN
jgi:hypothetical protein